MQELLHPGTGRFAAALVRNGLVQSAIWQVCMEMDRQGTTGSNRGGAEVVVMLLPSRTDTVWFHKYLYNKKNVELRFVKGRLHFSDADPSPFPSLVAVIRKRNNKNV